MNEIPFALFDKRRCSIFLSGSGKEDFFKHTCASMLVEAQASAPGAVMKVKLCGSRSIICKKARILRRDLAAQCSSQRAEAECTQVFVEVAHPRRQGKRLNARSFGAFGQCRERRVTRGIGVAGDVEPKQRQREQKGGKVIGRERGSHRHGRQRIATISVTEVATPHSL